MHTKKKYSIRPTKKEDIPALNRIYFKLTGRKRTVKQATWEWFYKERNDEVLSWVIVLKNQIVKEVGKVILIYTKTQQ